LNFGACVFVSTKQSAIILSLDEPGFEIRNREIIAIGFMFDVISRPLKPMLDHIRHLAATSSHPFRYRQHVWIKYAKSTLTHQG
jgi:hypothetical protein